MGLCAAKLTPEQREQLERSKLLDKINRDDYDQECQKIKLLLLGAGESGKSTIFKQMKILHGKGFSQSELEDIIPVVYSNIIGSMKTLIEACEFLEFEIGEVEAAEEVMSVAHDAVVNPALGSQILKLWNDEAIKEAFSNKSRFQLHDCCEYYFNNLERIMENEYVPTIPDALQSRVRTSGIVVEKFKIDEHQFDMFDVGGQRNERKKWIHCFDDVTSVIFVAALSEYDQVLYEDSNQNRMDEAINLFAEICQSSWFEDTSMILFLNKRDLFQKKIRTFPIGVPPSDDYAGRFMDYTGISGRQLCVCGHGYPIDDERCTCGAYDSGVDYIRRKFLCRAKDSQQIYVHETCATDTSNIRHVFDSCMDIILRKNFETSGFV